MTTATSTIIAACVTAAGAIVGLTDGIPVENWTAMGLLAVLVLRSGARMEAAVDKNTAATNAMATALIASANAQANLVTEMRALITQQQEAHRDYAQARERAVAELKTHIGEAVREASKT